jgi:adhesin/invasin
VTATATDAAGVPAAGVVVTFTVAGQGYLSTATATTNAKGVATVKLVSNVAGMNTVSAAANGTAVAATTAVTFGNADANLSFSKSKHSAIVNFEFAGNAKVVVSVNGARVKTVYPADDMVGSIKVSLKKGKNKVTVSVAGVVTDARTVTTK